MASMKPLRWALAVIWVCGVGCEETPQYPPADPAAMGAVKSGTSLATIVRKLGEPHEPTSHQAKHMEGTLERMPQQHRGEAETDRTVAWGNDSAFVVAKVNAQGVVWVTSYTSGGGQPNAQPRGETLFQGTTHAR